MTTEKTQTHTEPVPPAVRVVGWLVIVAVLLVALAMTLVVVRVARPRQQPVPIAGAVPPESKQIEAVITPDVIAAYLDAFEKMGSRFTGSSGCDSAGAMIEADLQEMGFEVIAQPFSVAVPQTVEVSLADEAGAPLTNVRLSPLLPNGFVPCSTPLEGLSGTVLVGERGLAREFEGRAVAGNIVLLPVGAPWSTVASMGAAAVLYYRPAGSVDRVDWPYRESVSLDLPRFLIEGENLPTLLDGQRVVIRSRVDWQNAPATNYVGLLRGGEGARREAVVLLGYYDSFSYAPDRAPGAEQACGAITMLAAAQFLAQEKNAHQRDVIVVLTAGHGQALAGVRSLLRAAAGPDTKEQARLVQSLQAKVDETRAQEQTLIAALALNHEAYLSAQTPEAIEAFWAQMPEEVRAAHGRAVVEVLDAIYLEAYEQSLQARLDWVRDGMRVRDGEQGETAIFAAYRESRTKEARAKSMRSATPPERHRLYGEDLQAAAFSKRIERRLLRMRSAYRTQVAEHEAILSLSERLAQYRRVQVLGVDVTSGGHRLGVLVGQPGLGGSCLPADIEVLSPLAAAAADQAASAAALGVRPGRDWVENLVRTKDLRALPFSSPDKTHPYTLQSLGWLYGGYPSFSIVTLDDARPLVGTPSDTFAALRESDEAVANLCVQARVLAGGISRMARGMSQILPVNVRPSLKDVRVRAVSQLGDSLVPNQPIPDALARIAYDDTVAAPLPGLDAMPVAHADVLGVARIDRIWPGFCGSYSDVTLDVAAVNAEGRVDWALSPQSAAGQSYSVEKVPLAHLGRGVLSAVLFRAVAVSVFPMPDPTTMRPYEGFDFLSAKGLTAPKESNVKAAPSGYVGFVPPDTRLYLTFKRGAKENPELMSIAAFALHADADGAEMPVDGVTDAELVAQIGPGYLAADTPRIRNVEIDAALSMTRLNGARLALQRRYGMTDAMLERFHETAQRNVQAAQQAQKRGNWVAAKAAAREAVAYASNIHPVIRRNASDAIYGILFYLALAVPFAIFLEKLLVGHTDIRVALCIQGAIFLGFFAILWGVHPAFELVRSPYMILLGFLTFALAAMVSVYVSGRFRENISALSRSLHGTVETADVSRAGAAATAFALGLNNMRKRALRTGLTVATLILITFVMISFTSVSVDAVDVEHAIGKASYTGLLVRDRTLGDVADAAAPLNELFGKTHRIAERVWSGSFTPSPFAANERAEFPVFAAAEDGTRAEAMAHALLGMSSVENELLPLDAAFAGQPYAGWFEDAAARVCYLPRGMADRLRLEEEDVVAGVATVTISGQDYVVRGIFDENALAAVRDLDGEPILPVDIMAMGMPSGNEDDAERPQHQPRLPAGVVVLMPSGALPSRTLTASVAVGLQGAEDGQPLGYRDARGVIRSYLERTGEPAYFGLDGIAFYGGTFRLGSFEGLFDLILPILLSALTVLNTMRGSVYERRSELYVFNAVGLAPGHIRFLFLAEACVYAVVGAVGGYLLAQTVGILLEWAGLKETLGLTMNYSSLSVIFVTVILMVVVFASSLIPARMAAKLAAPAETLSRPRQGADGDSLVLDLPFTFTMRDQIAIVPYFMDWFDSFGEGSSGEFVCASPRCGAREVSSDVASPYVETTVWLKPYDLGVSQRVTLSVEVDSQTGDRVATAVMSRASGDRASWERCNHAFIGLLRKRFLTWRAVMPEDRERLFLRGREAIAAAASEEAAHG